MYSDGRRRLLRWLFLVMVVVDLLKQVVVVVMSNEASGMPEGRQDHSRPGRVEADPWPAPQIPMVRVVDPSWRKPFPTAMHG